jgi:UrcA family protein
MTLDDKQTILSKEKVMKTINYSNKRALVTVVILAAASFASGANAVEPSPGASSRTVRYSDLNLNTASGAKVLYQRIRGAAKSVCGDVDSKRLEEAAVAKACLDRAIVSSVRAVNSVQLNSTAAAHGYEIDSTFEVASLR